VIVGSTVSNLGRWRDNVFAVSLTNKALGAGRRGLWPRRVEAPDRFIAFVPHHAN